MQFIPRGFDQEKIIFFECNKQNIYNPFEIALQSMIGERVFWVYENDNTGNLIPRYYPIRYLSDPTQNSYAIAAMNWLIKNEIRSKDVGYWEYNYPVIYKEQKLTPPWYSSFAQSYVALSAILWYQYSNNKDYAELCLRALNGLVTSIKQGGTSFLIGEDQLWYEEIPSEKLTHIFNAHLISLIALMAAKEQFKIDSFNEYIEKGMKAFYSKLYLMDTGNWSAYDIPDSYNIMLQLIPSDSGQTIKIKNIFLSSNNNNDVERSIDLSQNNSFIQDKQNQWIAGIDWGRVDKDGYREIIYGFNLHSVPVPTGDRQNTFVYFQNVKTQSDLISLTLNYKAEHDTEIFLFRNSYNNHLVKLGFCNKISLQKGENEVTINIPKQAFADTLAEVYHSYHILLLEELNLSLKSVQISSLISRFRKYKEQFKQSELQPLSSPKLESLYVSVNQACGLTCKMCDFGVKNAEASLFKNLHPSMDNAQLDPDVLITRCQESIKTLKFVHFIGTEPTLYRPLSKVITQLKEMGLKVAVTTNGVILDKVFPDLLSSNIDELWISLDGKSDVHDYIRGKNGLFESIMTALLKNQKLIEKKQELGFKLYAAFAINPVNYAQISDFVQATKSVPIDSYWCTHLNYITPEIAHLHNQTVFDYPIGASTTHPDMNPNLVNPFIMWTSMMEAKNFAQKLKRNFVVVPQMNSFLEIEDFYRRPRSSVGKPRCDVPFSNLEINSDGSVCVMARCYQFEIGNIYNQSLNDIFHNYPMAKFRQALLDNGLWEACLRCCAVME
jgi:MoaA/NifB/PqqE/SkfB family radical SAM enzyme